MYSDNNFSDPMTDEDFQTETKKTCYVFFYKKILIKYVDKSFYLFMHVLKKVFF